MRTALLALVMLGAIGPTPQMCMGAQMAVVMAAAQETTLPADEWCQRAPVRSTKAHACACHQASCSDPDPEHLPAHTDAKCLSYCRTTSCQCPKADCP
jgi:hypothetical protein